MTSYSQGGGFYAASLRTQDLGNADQKEAANGGEGRHGHRSRYSSDAQSSRSGLKSHRGKRSGRTAVRGLHAGPRIGILVCLVLCIVTVTIIGGDYLFSLLRNHRGGHESYRSDNFFENQDVFSSNLARSKKSHATDWGDDADHENYHRDGKEKRSLQFGKAFVQKEELVDRDSRYWDKDDRVREKYLDYDDTIVGVTNGNRAAEKNIQRDSLKTKDKQETRNRDAVEKMGAVRRYDSGDTHWDSKSDAKQGKLTTGGNGGLYNERGRKELRIYEEQLEAALKEELNRSSAEHASEFDRKSQHKDGEVDDQVHGQAFSNGWNQTEANGNEDLLVEDDGDDEYGDTGTEDDESKYMEDESLLMDFEGVEGLSHQKKLSGESVSVEGADESSKVKPTSKALHAQDTPSKKDLDAMQQQLNRKTKRHRHASNPCEMDFLETTQGLHEPETDARFESFPLKYVETENPQGIVGWEPRFAGHQTLKQRNQSFIAGDQTLHCGFIQEVGAHRTTGFDLAEDDVQYLHTCKIAVSSCIFGSSDNVRSPRNRKLTGSFKKDVCFVMFVDQSTLDVMQQEGQQLDDGGYLGPWKVVLVKNMPYVDARRVGKIPKFLTHRLFPAAKYSIWLDSKLRLQNDPVLILEYFLWRGGHEYAISNHYDRHCVWEEVQQNKKLNKYNHTAIDEQFAYYQADGLTRFNASNPKKLLPSNVPEGSFIVRAHTPMSNLFSCLWFNEVDRFTSRDQLSFAYTYMKFVRTNPDKHFYFNMFKDCERKSITKLFRHRKTGSSIQSHTEEIAHQ